MINTDHNQISDSIFPVLLKVRPGKDDVDIDVQRNILREAFTKEVE